MIQLPSSSTPFPYTTLFRSRLPGVGPAGLLPRLLELVLGDLGGEVPAPGQGPQHVAQLGGAVQLPAQVTTGGAMVQLGLDLLDPEPGGQRVDGQDRKSTRLNSSHVAISYALF